MNLSKHKTWALAFLAGFAFFLALNFVVWRGFTAEMMNAKEYFTPDLVRLGYIRGSTLYRKPESTLPKKHFYSADYAGQQVDILTIGDSFSNMKDNGRDPMYQDWLATIHDKAVMNVPRLHGFDEFKSLIALVNSGYLDKVRPEAVVLECVERSCIGRLAGNIDLNFNKSLKDIEEEYGKPEPKLVLPAPGYINTGNFKFLGYSVLYRFSPNAFFSMVYMNELKTPLFSVPREKRLLFFFEDLATIHHANAETVGSLNKNLNALARLLKRKGLTLYFMPAPNKLTVYYDTIVDNRYPRSAFFELLREEPKEYVFVDTKKVLTEEVEKGEKDVYFPDDTHWSWKASKKVVESMRF